ncbi:MAG: hypothetical protein WDO73_05355 [Ignavibacteriota bacterium]
MLTDCGEYRPRLIELARGAVGQDERRVLMAHVELCADCAQVLDEQTALGTALGSLAEDPLPEMAEIEKRVLAEFDRARWRWRLRLPILVPIAACLAAAALVGVVAMRKGSPVEPADVVPAAEALRSSEPVAAPSPQLPIAPVTNVRQVAARPQMKQESRPFLPIPYTVPLAPEEQATVVRMQVPVAALIAAGFNVAATDAGAVVDADVLVSQDGRARAIRF